MQKVAFRIAKKRKKWFRDARFGMFIHWHKGNGHWIVTTPPSATDNIPEGQRPNMYDNSIKVPALIK